MLAVALPESGWPAISQNCVHQTSRYRNLREYLAELRVARIETLAGRIGKRDGCESLNFANDERKDGLHQLQSRFQRAWGKSAGLSERLRDDGIETLLDQYVNGAPEQGWPRWMLDQLDAAAFVLIVCTETYYRRFRGHEVPGKGKGVDWERALITQELYDSRSRSLKFVPVFLSAAVEAGVPDLWWKYVGLDGRVIGIPRFGMSAPGGKVMEVLGITPEAVVAAVRSL